jgi:hypothetical protein
MVMARRGWREISAKTANPRRFRAAPEKIGVCARGLKSLYWSLYTLATEIG